MTTNKRSTNELYLRPLQRSSRHNSLLTLMLISGVFPEHSPNFHRYFLISIFRTAPSTARQIVIVFTSLRKNVHPCTGTAALYRPTAHWGSRGIALPLHDQGTRSWWGVNVTPRALFTPGKDPVPIVQEVGWAPEPVWKCEENIVPTGIRFPEHHCVVTTKTDLSGRPSVRPFVCSPHNALDWAFTKELKNRLTYSYETRCWETLRKIVLSLKFWLQSG